MPSPPHLSSKHTCFSLWQICLTSEAWTALFPQEGKIWGLSTPSSRHISPHLQQINQTSEAQRTHFPGLDDPPDLVLSMSTVLLNRFKQDFKTILNLQASRKIKLGHGCRLDLGFTTISTTQWLWPTHIAAVPVFNKLLKPGHPPSLRLDYPPTSRIVLAQLKQDFRTILNLQV